MPRPKKPDDRRPVTSPPQRLEIKLLGFSVKAEGVFALAVLLCLFVVVAAYSHGLADSLPVFRHIIGKQ
jgi:hypothetical protein